MGHCLHVVVQTFDGERIRSSDADEERNARSPDIDSVAGDASPWVRREQNDYLANIQGEESLFDRGSWCGDHREGRC